MDNQTLLMVLALVATTSSVALIFNWLGNRHIPGLSTFALGFSLSSIGLLLLTLQGSLHPALSILTANALLEGGRIVLVFGFALFWNQESSRLPFACACCYALSIATLYYFTFVEESTLARIRIYGATMVLASACIVYLIVKGLKLERRLRPAMIAGGNYGALLVVCLFAGSAITEIVLMFLRSGVPVAAADAATSTLLLVSIVSLVALSIAIILMTADELSLELQENAVYDPVTSILNHRSFLEVGNRLLGVAYRNRNPVSLITLQIENMDELLRLHGHKAVNDMLRHYAVMANNRRRREDVLGRAAFDKFYVLLPGIDQAEAQAVLRQILQAQADAPFLRGGQPLLISLRLGTVTGRDDQADLLQLLQESDVRLEYARHYAAEGESANPETAAAR